MKILVSACLLGENCKYNGGNNYSDAVAEFVKGREFSVGVLGERALPAIEIIPKEGFYDYKNKYQAGSTIETCPAEISGELTNKMQDYAQQVFEALRQLSFPGLQDFGKMRG